MTRSDELRLEMLRQQVNSCHAAVVAARGRLIETLGDHMCGSGSGPSAEDHAAFERALAAEADARALYARFVVTHSCNLAARIRPGARTRRTR